MNVSEEYLQKYVAGRGVILGYAFPVTIICGIILNVLSILTILLSTELNSKTTFRYFAKLLMADTAILLAYMKEPFEYWNMYINDKSMCRLLHYFRIALHHFSAFLVIITTTDRAILITLSKRTTLLQKLRKPKAEKIISGTALVISLLLSIDMLFYQTVTVLPNETFCGLPRKKTDEHYNISRLLFVIHICIFSSVTSTICFFLTIIIIWKLISHQRRRSGNKLRIKNEVTIDETTTTTSTKRFRPKRKVTIDRHYKTSITLLYIVFSVIILNIPIDLFFYYYRTAPLPSETVFFIHSTCIYAVIVRHSIHFFQMFASCQQFRSATHQLIGCTKRSN
ncbi:hypothetical protein SNEBB_009209 [Seison nebaliae]|nr:hypothetical protein SNEBB_009209 [Seison nebaliae]